MLRLSQQRALVSCLTLLRCAFLPLFQRQVEAKTCLTQALLDDHFRLVSAAVTICYPGGLPPHDPVAQLLALNTDFDGGIFGADFIAPDAAALWGPGTKLLTSKGPLLSDTVGRNDKTRVLLRLQRLSEGAPGREPSVSAEEQAAMAAFYRKKQEEAQRLAAAADEVETYDAPWATPGSLKAQLVGVSSVRLGGRGASGFNQGVM